MSNNAAKVGAQDIAAVRAELIAAGFQLFPVRANAKVASVEGWNVPGRHFDLKPYGNAGIFTGAHRDGGALLVLDVDMKDGRDGESSLRALEDMHGSLPLTREHATPSGGRHIIFRVADAVSCSAGKLGEGLDVRSANGYIVAPGSIIDGKAYTVACGGEIADAPQWLIDLCGQRREREPDAGKPLPGVDRSRAEQRAIDYLKNEAPVAVQGDSGDATAYKVAARVKDLGVSADDCAALMFEHWNDRCAPPWTLDELAVKVANAYRYGLDRQGADAPEAIFAAEPLPVAVREAEQPGAKPTPTGPTFHVRKASALLADPDPEWLIDGLLPDRGLGVIFGAPASGKSFLALDIAAAIARGVSWGARDVRKGKVVYVGLEGRQRSRIEAYLQHHKLKRDGLDNVLVIERQPLDLLAQRFEPAAALVRDVSAVAGHDVRAMFIDTLNRAMPGGDENSSQDMGQAITAAQAIADRLGCLVVIVHHSGKDTTQGARGHSSLHGAADVELEVSRKDDVRTVKLVKLKDGEDGHKWTCRLQSVSLGRTAKGKPRGSCVVAELATAEKRDANQPSPAEQVVLMALRDLTNAKREDPTTAGDYFAEVMTTRDEWRQAYFDAENVSAIGGNAQEKRQANDRFRKAVDRLTEKGLVHDCGRGRYALPT